MTDLEKQPLKPDARSIKAQRPFHRAYSSTNAAVTIHQGQETQAVVDYDAEKLASVGVFSIFKGTILDHKILWIEQAIVMFFFILPMIILYFFPPRGFYDWVNREGGRMQSFTSIMAGLAGLLLSFYTSLSVSRWWRLRTSGVGSIWSASSQLSLLISQMVTKDEEVLSAVRRYARASLMMVFIKRRYGAEKFKENLPILTERGVLTEDEVTKLQTYNNNLAESIWTWNVNIVVQLYQQGLIKSEYQYNYILERAMIGRGGAATIGAQLATPIPFQYVHLLCLMVKMHNIALAILLGMIMASAMHAGHVFECCQIGGRVFLVPFMYNALLLINEQLADPFSGDISDFPMSKYEAGVEGDGKSYVQAGENLPSWLTAGKKFEGV